MAAEPPSDRTSVEGRSETSAVDMDKPTVATEPGRPGEPGEPVPAGSEGAGERTAGDTAGAGNDTGKPASEPSKAASPRETPGGFVGVVDKADGLLLRLNPEKREWERLSEGNPLGTSDRLLCLAPFQARIIVATTPMTLIGETQIRLVSKTAKETPALELIEGRVVLDGPAPSETVKVEFSGHTLVLARPSVGSIGLERTSTWIHGKPATLSTPLTVHASEGELSLTLDQTKHTLTGPGAVSAGSNGRFEPLGQTALPVWLTQPQPSIKDSQLGQEFAKQFSAGRPILADLVVATESDSEVTKKLAVFGLKALGDLSLLTPILSKANDPGARQSAIAAIRQYMAQGPQALKVLREQLEEEFGGEAAKTIEKLLAGYSTDESSRHEVLSRLVEFLSPREPSIVIRELALENLKHLTGRDNHGYDAANPDEKGYNAWKTLLNDRELKPAVKRKAAG